MFRMANLDHDKLDVYRHALAFVATAGQIADSLPRRRGDRGDRSVARPSAGDAGNI